MDALAVTGSSVPSRHPEVSFRVYEGQAVVLVPRTGEAKILNEVGARIWELMDGRRSLEEIAGTVQDEFAVEAPRAVADVHEFVRDLVDHSMAVIDG